MNQAQLPAVVADLKPFIQEAWKAAAFEKLTEIQEASFPLILAGKDVIAESPTGTGKTLAYLLPLLEKIDPTKKNVQAVILAPSRELVMQILEQIQQWSQGSEIAGVALIGGANVKKQLENLKKRKPQIIVGTTGRLLELIKMKKLKMHEVKTIVVDEFDMLIAQEHVQNVKEIVKSTLKDRQLLFYSATLPEKTEKIGTELMKEPQVVKMSNDENAHAHVQHLYILSEKRDKIDVLRRLVNNEPVKAIVFLKDFERISELEQKLTYKGVALDVLHGESSKTERQKALKSFRASESSVLLATDVAARGLDIDEVTHVIHFDFPRDVNQYIHRSGRTGRMGKAGTVISIVTRQEESFLKKMQKELTVKLKQAALYKGKIHEVPNRK